MSCLTSMIEPLRAANEIAGREMFHWQLISETAEKVRSSAQVIFEPDVALMDVDAPDLVFLLSGPTGQFARPRSANAALRRLERAGTTLGGISGGVFPLVRAGVMTGHRCCVHWCYEAAFRAEFPDMLMTDDVIVADQRRYTVAGAAAAFELALRLIEERLSSEIAHEVACWFQHPMMRGDGVRQQIPVNPQTETELPDLVAQAVALFGAHMSVPISVAEVAEQIGVTPRQVERAFKKATGQNPTNYFRTMRMKAARQMVLYTKDSLVQVANAVGYSSTTPLVTHYRKTFGLHPYEDRRQINAFRVESGVPVPSV